MTVYQKISSFIRSFRFSFLLSPPYCVSCKVFLGERVPLCGSCEDDIEHIVSTNLSVGRFSITVFALSDYTGSIRSLILAKHRGQRLASKQLGQLIVTHCSCDWNKFDYIIPVPLHWTRYASRGFNQAHVMANEVSSAYDIPVSCAIKRRSRTAFQARLMRDERKKNISGVFHLDTQVGKKYEGKHLLIVDDLMTTGTTLQEIARVVARCKPASITVLVAARVV